MSFILKPFKIIQTHWKKSILFGCASAYSYNYVETLYNDHILRRAYCLEAIKHGHTSIPLGDSPMKVTVFLNPAVKGGRGVKLFERNVAPILHLAGLDVTIIKTEYEGQIKKYMEVLDKTDAIIVAGGDGTLLEVVTGLLRRKDNEFNHTPIGIIPLGSTNTLSQVLHVHDGSNVHWLLEAAMSIVLQKVVAKDILEIKSEKGDVYAVSKLHWGVFRDAEANTSKYWYFGGLKHRWTYIRESFGVWPKNFKAKIQYEKPCEGCSTCFQMPTRPSMKWWHFLIPPNYEVPITDYSTVINKECGTQYGKEITISDFSISLLDKTKYIKDKCVDVKYLNGDIDKFDFIEEGWRRLISDKSRGKIPLKQLLVQKIKVEPMQEDTWFTVDNEYFEAMPVEINLLRDRMLFFTSNDTPAINQ